MFALLRRRACPLVLVSALAVLSACGGGGGGDSAPSGVSSVTVTLDSPRQITGQFMPSDRLPDVTLRGHASGDVASLNGRQLFIVVEDPHALFQPNPGVLVTGSNVAVTLSGMPLNTSGVLSGNITVRVCLDMSCQTELRGSPMTVPYSVTVLPGLSAPTTVPAVTTAFGDPVVSRSFPVGLPTGVTEWRVEVSTSDGGTYPFSVVLGSSATDPGGTSGTVTLNFHGAPVGTRNVQATVMAFVGTQYLYHRIVQTTYTVTDNPNVDLVFAPAQKTVVRRFGDALSQESPYWSIPKPGVTLRPRGTEYLTYPPEAAGHPNLNSWWYEYPYIISSPCYSTVNSSDCLPVGTYTARVRYTVSKAGAADTDVYYPVTLTIVP